MTEIIQTPVYLRYPGMVAYEQAFEEMQRFNAARTAATKDEIWLVEHPSVFTLGTNASRDHLLDAGDTPVVQVDRGGQVTWHGPGQLLVYVLLDLQRKKLGVRDLVCRLERSVIRTLKPYGIDAEGCENAPGVYTGGKKIASIGLRIRHQRCYHGMAINVNPDLSSFSGINPCGYEGLEVTRSCDLGGPATIAEFTAALLPALLDELQLVAASE